MTKQMTKRFMLRGAGILGASLFFSGACFSQNYTMTVLTSDGSVTAPNTDSNLLNAWGLSRSSTSPWWVSDNHSGKSTLYDGTGAAKTLIVTIPTASGNGTGSPTGTIYNGTQDFQIASGKPAVFLFCTEDGTISGWNSGVDSANAKIMVTTAGANYKGMTAAVVNGSQYLYVTNFASGKVEVYDAAFQPVDIGSNAFQLRPRRFDPLGPFENWGGSGGDWDDLNRNSGLVPYNIQNIGGTIYVTFAKQNADRTDSESGAGLGAVAAFDPTGRLLKTFGRSPLLNAPWGLTLAPGDFGSFSHCLLVGQFGSGQVIAYNTVTGQMVGVMADADDHPISIDGLWALSFGNGTGAGSATTLYFTAGPHDEANGIFGSLVPVASALTQGNNL
jgi:uncharacterized protein (TIGR03118 family)